MTSKKTQFFILLLFLLTSCTKRPKVRQEDKIFHATDNGELGGIFFELFKENKYQFCDGDFMNPGCYTGFYSLSGDTIILNELRKHDGIPTNRFIIRRYGDLDSSYWQWKYPDDITNWRYNRSRDSLIGSTGDVFPLDPEGKIIFDKYKYFIIRMDSLKKE